MGYIKQAVLVVMAFTLLAGCGGEDSSSGGLSATASITTASSVDGEAIVINPAVNGGAFALVWDVSFDGMFHASINVSEDEILDASDIELLEQNCNGYGMSCDSVGSLDCSFSNENKIECGDMTPINISSIYDTIPADAYFIFEICDGLFEECVEHAVEVTFE